MGFILRAVAGDPQAFPADTGNSARRLLRAQNSMSDLDLRAMSAPVEQLQAAHITLNSIIHAGATLTAGADGNGWKVSGKPDGTCQVSRASFSCSARATKE
ncbi:hypothetical protein ACVNF4_20275 [Streptomyces sp. S6]